METTPKEIDDAVLKLCKRLVPNSSVRYIDLQPENYCSPSHCFQNVREKVLRDGGSEVIGWAIWRYDNILIEAEAHSVWRSSEGRFIDVTPQSGGEKEILFLEDNSLSYEGKQIDNIRMPLTDSKLVEEYIGLHEEKFKLIGGYPVGTPIILDGQNRIKYEEITCRIGELGLIFHSEVGRNDPCPCGSGRKYKKCCLPWR